MWNRWQMNGRVSSEELLSVYTSILISIYIFLERICNQQLTSKSELSFVVVANVGKFLCCEDVLNGRERGDDSASPDYRLCY